VTKTGTYFDYETIAERTPTYDGLERGIFEHSVKVKSMYMLASRMNTRGKGVKRGKTIAGSRFKNRTLRKRQCESGEGGENMGNREFFALNG
jgi:hypothetical protein